MNTKVRRILSAAACAAIALPLGLQGQPLSLISAVDTVSFPVYSSSSTDASPLLQTESHGTALMPVAVSVVVAAPPASKPSAPRPLTARWLDLGTLSYSVRYRDNVNSHGRRLFEFGQERYIADGRFKFDEPGNYFIGFHMSTGRYFNWAFADTIGGQYKDSVVAARAYKTPAEKAALSYALARDPNAKVDRAGLPSRGGYFTPRLLFISATPVTPLTLEFGSLSVERGQNSEITSFDEDGYIAGERVRLRDPGHLFFDQLVATSAFLGSDLAPDFFKRGSDLQHANYTQYLAEKKFAGHFAASVDFTQVNHTRTMREAATYKLLNRRFIDAARVELYQRPTTVQLAGKSFASGNGFAVSTHQTFYSKLGFEGGFASVDDNYAIYSGSIYLATVAFAWNADSFGNGTRGFARSEVKLGHGVTAFGFYTHTLETLKIGQNQQGLTGGMTLDVKEMINRERSIF